MLWQSIFYMFVMLSLSVSIPGKLKRLLDRGRNRTRDLWWFASSEISRVPK